MAGKTEENQYPKMPMPLKAIMATKTEETKSWAYALTSDDGLNEKTTETGLTY